LHINYYLCDSYKKRQVIKTITTYEDKNKHFKRIDKHSNEKRKDGHGGSRFFKTVQNWATVKAIFRSKETGKTDVIGSGSDAFKSVRRNERLCDASNRPFRNG
jgi:hypothetical protein